MSTETSVPTHLGIIPDGNRRWAKQHGKTSLEGHQRGFDVARTVALAAFDRGVRYLTMFAFSTENWQRTREEVSYLMKLFETGLLRELREIEERGVRVCVLGERAGLPKSLAKALTEIEERTKDNMRGTLSLCLNYGGEQELATAVSALAQAQPEGPYTYGQLREHLYTPEIPNVDLIIRSSGEQRTSGFMLGRAAYAELYFVEKHWPDFDVADLDAALAEYARRHRRFGS